jgi:hypothetical protein
MFNRYIYYIDMYLYMSIFLLNKWVDEWMLWQIALLFLVYLENLSSLILSVNQSDSIADNYAVININLAKEVKKLVLGHKRACTQEVNIFSPWHSYWEVV